MVAKRLFVRAGKHPFDVFSVERTAHSNLIGDNSGNLLFSHSAQRLLSTDGTTIDACGLMADPTRAGEVNEKYDMLVLPFANAFRRSFAPKLVRYCELIEQVKLPVAVLSVGMQLELGEDVESLSSIAPVVKRFIGAVLDRGPAIGVRGEATAEYLRGLGFKDVEVIGCPSVFMYGDTLRVEKKVPRLSSLSSLSVNYSPNSRMAEIALNLSRRYPNLYYVAQDVQTLKMMLWGAGFSKGVNVHLPRMGHPFFVNDRARFFVDPITWMQFLSKVDLSFGMRIHGNIAAVLAGTPSLLFAHDSRTLELGRYLGLPHRLLGDLPDDCDLNALYAEVDYGEFNRLLPQRFATFAAYLKKHGLRHCYEVGQESARERFDRKLALTDFPREVRPAAFATPQEIVDRLGWLFQQHQEKSQDSTRRWKELSAALGNAATKARPR